MYPVRAVAPGHLVSRRAAAHQITAATTAQHIAAGCPIDHLIGVHRIGKVVADRHSIRVGFAKGLRDQIRRRALIRHGIIGGIFGKIGLILILCGRRHRIRRHTGNKKSQQTEQSEHQATPYTEPTGSRVTTPCPGTSCQKSHPFSSIETPSTAENTQSG